MNEQNGTDTAPLQYEPPTLQVIGTVAVLTQGSEGGSSDSAGYSGEAGGSGTF